MHTTASRMFSAVLLLIFVAAISQSASAISWKTAAPAPIARFEGQGVAAHGKLYVFGGFFNSNLHATKRCDVYDPVSNTWKRLADMPEAVTHSGAAVDGNFIYLAGGFVGNHPGPVTSHVWRYDIAKNQWSAFISLPKARGSGMVVRLGRQLHYFGGTIRQGNTYLSDPAEHWAISLDEPNALWMKKAPLPNPRNHLGGVALHGKIYAVGGQHLGQEHEGNQTSFHAYDPATDSWTAKAAMPRPLGHITASVFVMNQRVVVLGGVTNGHIKVANIIAYNPATNQWRELGKLPAGRQSPVAGAVQTSIIVQGGYNKGLFATTWVGSLQSPEIETTKELVFSGVKGSKSAGRDVVITNKGAAALSVNALGIKGTHAAAFQLVSPPALPFSIASGQSRVVKVSFVPGSLTGSLQASLHISSNDADESTKEVGLYGLSAKGEQGDLEPSLSQIVKTLGYQINVGGTGLILGTGAAPIGDEVLLPLFQKAGTGAVRIRPVARYSPDDVLPFGYYTLSNEKPVLQQVAAIALKQEQQLHPAIVSTGKDHFDPGNATFGFYVGKTRYAQYNNYTQDKLNAGPVKHAARVYPLRNRNGQAVANSYLIAFEPASNGDYQDYVFVVENVKKAATASPMQLITQLKAESNKPYAVASLQVQKPYYTDRSYVVTSLPAYLKGAAAIRTPNDDKNKTNTSLLSFTLSRSATVYVAYDARSSKLPSWLQGWIKLPDKVGVNDAGTSGLQLYSKHFPAGKVTLGGNLCSPAVGAKTNFIVAATEKAGNSRQYEAEVAQLYGAVKSSSHAGYSGSGYVDYVHAGKDYIQWNVEKGVAEKLSLTIRYANGGMEGRSMALSVNGKTVHASLLFPSTGSWSKWAVLSLQASLSAGNNTIRLTATGDSGPNVDYLSLGSAANQRMAAKATEKVKAKPEATSITPAKFVLFPNPVDHELTLSYFSETKGKIIIMIQDSQARILKKTAVQVIQGANLIQLPVEDMNNGLYLLSLIAEEHAVTEKFMIDR